MTIGNVELMHECSPERLHMETARMTRDKDTGEEGIRREDLK